MIDPLMVEKLEEDLAALEVMRNRADDVLVKRALSSAIKLLSPKITDLRSRRAFILENYEPVTESGCWLWLGGWHKEGYGRIHFRNNGKTIVASRFFYMHLKGAIPEGHFICHKCDTPACVNPDHLYVGTPQDNSVDREQKGRGRFKRIAPIKERRGRHKPYADDVTIQFKGTHQ